MRDPDLVCAESPFPELGLSGAGVVILEENPPEGATEYEGKVP